nr:hypothetical protein B11C_110610 [Bartonella sp. 1-1C]
MLNSYLISANTDLVEQVKICLINFFPRFQRAIFYHRILSKTYLISVYAVCKSL